MKNTSKLIAVAALVIVVCAVLVSRARTQPPTPPYGPPSPAGTPTMIHIHHHYVNPGASYANLVSGYRPPTAWNYGNPAAVGASVQPWKQNWGHLGFTGYLGQHGGGVEITPDSFPVFTGLVVDTVTPGSTAARLGLVPGDFILEINGVKVNNYKQVADLFEQTQQNPGADLSLDVWNPHTRRSQILTTKLED